VRDGITTTHVPERASTTGGMLRFYPGLELPLPPRPYAPPRLSGLQRRLVDGSG
jgi:hypothetical protein